MNRNGCALLLGGLLTTAALFGGTAESAEVDDPFDNLRREMGVMRFALSTDHVDPLPARSAAKPNIVLIFADDLGYGELSSQGCTDIPTPNIDSIARNGIRFTQGYVTHPVCAPSRAGLMTGQYQHRFGFEHNPGPAEFVDPNVGIEPGVITLAERLKEYGYTTGIVGKWHLGYREEYQPTANGFDEFFGFLGGGHNYLPKKRRPGRGRIYKNDTIVDEPEYLTDAFGREAVDFIMRHEREPFFLYLSFNAVHMPLEATTKDLRKYEAIHDRDRRTFAAMIEAMDRAVGNVLGTLRKLNLEENTLVFFISDNGGPTKKTTSSNGPLRGYKGQMYEGGIRVPFMIQWKNHLPSGTVYEYPVSALDVHPTAVAAAGEKVNPEWNLDGVDLLPYLKAENQDKPHKTLFWRAGDRHAVLDGDWKLVLSRGASRPDLFHIATDIGEADDLAGENPEKVEHLQGLFAEWSNQMEPPRWIRRAPRKPKEKKLRKEERERIELGIMSRLIEELDLDQETADKLFPVLNESNKRQRELRRKRGRTMKQIRDELDRESPEATTLQHLIKDFKQIERDLVEARIKKLDDLSKVLSDEQIANVIVLVPKIEKEVKKTGREERRIKRKRAKDRAKPESNAQSVGGWEQSFKASMIDESTGKPIRGTEIVHLVAHKGRLYAGNGY